MLRHSYAALGIPRGLLAPDPPLVTHGGAALASEVDHEEHGSGEVLQCCQCQALHRVALTLRPVQKPWSIRHLCTGQEWAADTESNNVEGVRENGEGKRHRSYPTRRPTINAGQGIEPHICVSKGLYSGSRSVRSLQPHLEQPQF